MEIIQTVIVFMMIGVSFCCLLRGFIKSLRSKKGGHCSGCGKE